MVCEVIGIQRVEYDKKDGSGHVSGVNLFIATPIPSDRGSGVAVTREYVSSAKFPKDLGCGTYDIDYGKSYTGNAFINSVTPI